MSSAAVARLPGWLTHVPVGDGGAALDLGGRYGQLGPVLEQHGYRYVNIDLHPSAAVTADAHRLPFRDAAFDLVVSVDSLEHFIAPWQVLGEVRRVLRPQGRVVVSVPWMHPFHGDDLWRFSPLGLHRLMQQADFEIERLDPILGPFTTLSASLGSKLGPLAAPFARSAKRVDRWMRRRHPEGNATAHAFLVVATPAAPTSAPTQSAP